MPAPTDPANNDPRTSGPAPDSAPVSTPEEDLSTGAALADKAKAAYQWWDHLATFHPDDPWWLGGLKMGFRAVGVIVLLVLSPVIILGIMIGFAAVL